MTDKLRSGKWVSHDDWVCRCIGSWHLNYAFAKACWWCHSQRPRKGFGGARPKRNRRTEK